MGNFPTRNLLAGSPGTGILATTVMVARGSTMRIASVGRAFPPHYYDQETLIAALEQVWGSRHRGVHRLATIHRNTLVGGRHLALPLAASAELTSFTAAGAAAAVLVGADRAEGTNGAGAPGCAGPTVVASRSVFYRDSEDVMGWDVTAEGFRVVLSADVPKIIEARLAADVDAFLSAHGLTRADVASYVCHPGGPHVLQAVQRGLGLADDALAVTWDSLTRVGTRSSAC